YFSDALAHIRQSATPALDLHVPASRRIGQDRLDHRGRQPGALLEQPEPEPVHQPQRVEHELERAPPRRDNLVTADRGRRAGIGEVPRRVLVLPAAQDRFVVPEGYFSVRTGTYPEIVTVGPIVEVVRALATGPRIGTDLVLRITGPGEHGLAALLDVPAEVLVGDAGRRPRREHGVGLQRELVMTDVRRL